MVHNCHSGSDGGAFQARKAWEGEGGKHVCDGDEANASSVVRAVVSLFLSAAFLRGLSRPSVLRLRCSCYKKAQCFTAADQRHCGSRSAREKREREIPLHPRSPVFRSRPAVRSRFVAFLADRWAADAPRGRRMSSCCCSMHAGVQSRREPAERCAADHMFSYPTLSPQPCRRHASAHTHTHTHTHTLCAARSLSSKKALRASTRVAASRAW